MKYPKPNLTFPAKILNIHDGDTVKVQSLLTGMIHDLRIYDCLAPELKEKGGPEAREYAKKLLAPLMDRCLVTVWLGDLKADGAINLLKELSTMSRLVADIWVDDETTLGQCMVGSFHAKKYKRTKGK